MRLISAIVKIKFQFLVMTYDAWVVMVNAIFDTNVGSKVTMTTKGEQ